MVTSIQIAKDLQKVKFTKPQAEKIATLIKEGQGDVVTRDVLAEELDKALRLQQARIVNESWKIGAIYSGILFALLKYL